MNILILGGHGFIGHHLSKLFDQQGYLVTVVDLHHRYGEYQDWEYNPVLTQRLEHMGNHHFFSGDVCNAEFMDQVFAQSRPNIVIDLATYPNAKMVKKNVVDATTNMIAATAIALDLCVKHQVQRFVLASSSMVYGDFGSQPPDETADCNPLTLYGSYKLQCERMCKIWNREHKLEYCILRPSALYGTRDMVVRVISKMTVDALTTGTINVNGATNRLDFSWVEDVASAFYHAAVEPNCANSIFNCTRGRGRTISEAAEIIQSIIPSTINALPHDNFYPNRDTLDSQLLQQVSNWCPTVDIEIGIPDYVRWFMSQEFVSRF
jgi:nucleoside-diphosphate-sugar epimerase